MASFAGCSRLPLHGVETAGKSRGLKADFGIIITPWTTAGEYANDRDMQMTPMQMTLDQVGIQLMAEAALAIAVIACISCRNNNLWQRANLYWIWPTYWGEIVLLFFLLWALRRWNTLRVNSARVRLLTFFIGAFIVLGTIKVIPDYSTWGFDALRDFATCYYALFYFVGLVIAANSRRYGSFLSCWKFFWILCIPWVVEEMLSAMLGIESLGERTPQIRGHGALFGSSGSELVQNLYPGLFATRDRRAAIWHFSPSIPHGDRCNWICNRVRGQGARGTIRRWLQSSFSSG